MIRELIKLNLINYKTAFLLGIISVTFVFVVCLLNLNNPLDSFIYLAFYLGVFEMFKYLGVNPAEFTSKFSPNMVAMTSNPPGGGSSIPGGIGSSSGGSNPSSSSAQPSSESAGASTTERSNFQKLKEGSYFLEYGFINKAGDSIKGFRPYGEIPGPEVDLSDPRHRVLADNTSKGLKKIEELQGHRPTTACLDAEVRPWMLRVRTERLNHTSTKNPADMTGRLLRELDRIGTGNSD